MEIELDYTNSVNLLRLTNQVLLSGDRKKNKFCFGILILTLETLFETKSKMFDSSSERPSEQIFRETLHRFEVNTETEIYTGTFESQYLVGN